MTKEELLYKWQSPQPVLDHGHVQLIDVMGSDERIEQVARLSYGKGTRQVSETRALLRYLMRHRHTSPFEQAVITLDMKMPIFVARQLIRHRTASYNELSGRYSEMPEEYYVPGADQVCVQSSSNKQGRAEPVDMGTAAETRTTMRMLGEEAFLSYQDMLRDNVSRETARMVLPLSTYTQWCMTMNLHNLLHMLALRLDPHAQWETRQYASMIADIVKDWVPLTWEAFEDYRLESVTFSKQEVEALRLLLRERGVDAAGLTVAGLSTREQVEFISKLVQ